MKFVSSLFLFALLFLAAGIFQINAQATNDLRILVLSGEDGNPLISANVVLMSFEEGQEKAEYRVGQSTNSNGLATFRSIPPGRYRLKISYIGYVTYNEPVAIRGGEEMQILQITLEPAVEQLQNLTVEGEREVTTGEVGVHAISAEEIARVPTPVIGGDLVSYIQTLPGVVMAGDRGGELFIRGGTPNQNLILVDNLPIIKPFHISNIYSAFPGTVIENVNFYAGGFGAEYMGATSAVIDVKLRAGNMREYNINASAGTQVLSFQLEGPVKLEKSSFLITARKSLINYTTPKITGEEAPLRFYDISARFTFRPKGYTCNITGIRTFDRGQINFKRDINLSWQNNVIGASCLGYGDTWDYPIEFTIGFTNYKNSEKSISRTVRSSGVTKLYFKFDHTGEIFGHPFRYGFGISENIFDTKLADRFTRIETFNEQQVVIHTFVSTVWNPGEKVTVEPGIGTQITFQNVTFEPRLRVAFQPDGTDKYEISLAAGRYFQAVTGISDTRDAGTTFTVLEPLNYFTRQRPLPGALQGMLGFNMEIDNNIEFNIEGYVIDRQNIPVAKWTPIARINIETALADGLSFGLNTRVEFVKDPFYLSLSYAYAKTEYEASVDNLGAWVGGTVFSYNPPHDRRHKINSVGSFTFAGFTTSVSWEYGSGKPYTRVFGFDLALHFPKTFPLDFPTEEAGVARTLFSRPYGARFPSYHRLDLSIEKSFELAASATLDAAVGVINVYDRSNIFYFDSNTLTRVNQTSILPYLAFWLKLN